MKPGETATVTDSSSSSQWRRIGILICLAVSAGGGLVWSLEQRQISVFGILDAKKSTLTTNRAALIQSISVKSGEIVVPGQPLCQLIDDQLQNRLISQRRKVAECEAEISRVKATADVEIDWRRRQLEADIFETRLKIASLSQEKLLKEVNQLAWKERLAAADSVVVPTAAERNSPFSPISVDMIRPTEHRMVAMLQEDAAAAAAEALTTQIALCDKRLHDLEALNRNLENRIRASSGVDVVEARLNGSKQELIALEAQAKELKIISPSHGTIGNINFQAGDHVSDGSVVVEVLDDQQPHVTVQVPSQSASQFHIKAKVTLIFPTNEHRTGIVTAVPPRTVSVAGQTDSILPVKIEPTGKLWPKLAIGSNVKVQLQ